MMVAEIAEQIYRENLQKIYSYAIDFDDKNPSQTCQLNQFPSFPAASAAFNIIEENNPARFKGFLQEFASTENHDKQQGTKSRIGKNITCQDKVKIYFSILNNKVLVQFNDEDYRKEADSFAEKLDPIGWRVHVGEKVRCKGYRWINDKYPSSSVSYFHPSDFSNAKRIQKLATDHFNRNFVLDDLSSKRRDVAFGQIEVLVHYDTDSCSKDKSLSQSKGE